VTNTAANSEFAAMLEDEYILSFISLSAYIHSTEFYQLLLLSSSAAVPGWILINTSTAASSVRNNSASFGWVSSFNEKKFAV